MRIWQCDRPNCRRHMAKRPDVSEVEVYNLGDDDGAPRVRRGRAIHLCPQCIDMMRSFLSGVDVEVEGQENALEEGEVEPFMAN